MTESANTTDNSVTEPAVVESATVEKSVEPVATESAPTELHSLLSEELRSHKALQNFKDVNSMAKSLLSAQEMVGKRVSELSADELLSLNGKFGMPKDTSGYDFEADEAFKEQALELGLNHNQALKMLNVNAAAKEAADKVATEKAAAKVDAVTLELEEAFGGQLEARVDIAKKAALELGGEDLHDAVFNLEGGMDPKMIKALSEAGKRIFDHESVGTNQITKFGLTPQEALNEISLYKQTPEYKDASNNRDPAVRKAATDKLQKLYETAYPSK